MPIIFTFILLMGIFLWFMLMVIIGRVGEKTAFAHFDKKFIPQHRDQYTRPLKKGERVRMVVKQSRKAVVWPAVVGILIKLVLGIGLLSLIEGFCFVGVLLLGTSLGTAVFIFTLLNSSPIVIWAPFCIWQYWKYGWWCHRRKLIICDFTAIIFDPIPHMLGLIVPQGDIYESWGPTAVLTEYKFATDLTKLGSKKVISGPMKIWYRYLTSLEALGSMFLPSALLGGGDVFENVSFVAGVLKCIEIIAEWAKDFKDIKSEFMKLSEKIELSEDVLQKKLQLLAIMEAGFYQKVGIESDDIPLVINLLLIEDPHEYNPVTGEKYAVV